MECEHNSDKFIKITKRLTKIKPYGEAMQNLQEAMIYKKFEDNLDDPEFVSDAKTNKGN